MLPGPGRVHAYAGVEVAGHELVAAEGVHVVDAHGEMGTERSLEADRELVGVGDPPIGVVQGHGARVAHARAGREELGQQRAVDVGPLRRNGSDGSSPREGPGSAALAGKLAMNELEYTPAVTMAEMSSKCVLSKKRP